VVPKERVSVGGDEDFRSRFTGAVRVVTSQRIFLPKGMPSLLVPIDFIRGDENRRAVLPDLAERLQHVGGSQDVDLVGFQGVKIGIPDQRLSRKVENKIRTAPKDGFPDFPGIAQIADFVLKPIFELQL
jgi:hypothetical protein